jgi:hypothetical protein
MEAGALIEIAEVEQRPSAVLAGAEVNLPAAGDRLPTYALDLRGWAVGRDTGLTGVEIAAGGVLHRTAALDVERPQTAERLGVQPAIGFRALLNTLALPP